MHIKVISAGPLETNCYIVGCDVTHEAVIIDPGYDADTILKNVNDMKLKVLRILLTHGHFDHCSALRDIKEKLNIPIAVHGDDLFFISQAKSHAGLYGIKITDVPLPDIFIADEDTFEFGNYSLKTIHTPGHTAGSVCFLTGKYLFSGDTLFKGSIGRTDLPGGNYNNIINSILNRLYVLDKDTIVLPGHGPQTTIGDEIRFNPYTS